MFEVFKEAHRSACIESNSATTSMASVNKWLENNILEDTNILPMVDLEFDTSEDEQLVSSLRLEIKNISENNKKIIKNNKYREMLQAIDIDKLNNTKEVFTVYDPLVSQYGEQKALAAGSERTLKKLEKLEQVCPTCSQAISYNFKQSMITEAATKINIAKENINELNRRIKSIKAENARFEANTKAIRDWEGLYVVYNDDLPNTLVDKNKLESELEVVLARVQKRKADLASLAKENERRTKVNTRIQCNPRANKRLS